MIADADALISLAMLIGFVCLFYGPWQAICTDVARQLIFERRAALFDLARSGKMDFASPEYKLIRRSMESMIRYAHELTWPNLSFIIASGKSMGEKPPFLCAVTFINDEVTKEKVKSLLDESTAALMAMMAAKSIWLAPFITIFMVSSLCVVGFGALVKNMREIAFVRFLAGAIQLGSESASI
jgi:hypothetical protein